MHLIILQHLELEGPGRLAPLALARGWTLEIRHLYSGDPVPQHVQAGEALVVMGGPMGVGDLTDPRWPFLAKEVAALASLVPSGAPVLGICLGAQLIAHALGARVAPLLIGDPPVRHREVGWGAVSFHGDDPVLAGMPAALDVLHWHGDAFALPPGAVRLASTLACPEQMFRFGSRTFALQFHLEVEPDEIARWTREDADFVRSANGPGGPARILADTARIQPRQQAAADRLIGNLLDALAS
jgi:GMP synthase (glutamine-hydrolysing)